jgi:hypothetical protein
MEKPEAAAKADLAAGPGWSGAWIAVAATASVLVLLMIYLGPVQDKLTALGYDKSSFGLRYLAVTLLGALIGLAELLLRYRDEPGEAAATGPGVAFVLLNGAAAAAALFLVEYFTARPNGTEQPAAAKDTVERVLLSGLGAMVVLRGRLLSVTGPGGTRSDIGLAPLVEAILAAVNRSIDRGRAHDRIGLVTKMARDMAPLQFRQVAPFLRAGLQSLQTLDTTIQADVLENLKKLEDDTTLSSAVKFESIGYELLNNFGRTCFLKLFTEARSSAQAAGAAEGPRPGGT